MNWFSKTNGECLEKVEGGGGKGLEGKGVRGQMIFLE